jgi:hypothetical protein
MSKLFIGDRVYLTDAVRERARYKSDADKAKAAIKREHLLAGVYTPATDLSLEPWDGIESPW